METIIGGAVTLLFFILIFLAMRSIMLWYWKIPDIIKYQKEQIRLLKKIAGEG